MSVECHRVANVDFGKTKNAEIHSISTDIKNGSNSM